jgi:hypothetical protein
MHFMGRVVTDQDVVARRGTIGQMRIDLDEQTLNLISGVHKPGGTFYDDG